MNTDLIPCCVFLWDSERIVLLAGYRQCVDHVSDLVNSGYPLEKIDICYHDGDVMGRACSFVLNS
jgi:hypothetical protein